MNQHSSMTRIGGPMHGAATENRFVPSWSSARRVFSRRELLSLLLPLVGLGLAGLRTLAADWQAGEGFRSRELAVPATGRTFLQRLFAPTTGIAFSNVVSEGLG